MSLYINADEVAFEWHVGEQNPLHKKGINVATLTNAQVQADGDELERIKSVLPNIPMAYRSVVIWYGDTAKFILAHIFH